MYGSWGWLGGKALDLLELEEARDEGSHFLPFVTPGEGERPRAADPEQGGAEGDLFTHDVRGARVRDRFALSRAALFRVSAALRPE